MSKMFGYYSKLAEETFSRPGCPIPCNVQVGPNGERVMAWFNSKESAEGFYNWPDRALVGEFDTTTFRSVALNDAPWLDEYDPYRDWIDSEFTMH